MKEIINKLMNIEQETGTEKGGYELFGLFLREGASDKWDILVSAHWITNKEEALRYIAPKIQNSFSPGELLKISGIVIIDYTNPGLPALQQAIDTRLATTEIKDTAFFGLEIKHAYLITSGRRQAA